MEQYMSLYLSIYFTDQSSIHYQWQMIDVCKLFTKFACFGNISYLTYLYWQLQGSAEKFIAWLRRSSAMAMKRGMH